MIAFWIHFKNRGPGCIEAETKESALEIAKKHGEPTKAEAIGYPSDPRLNEYDHPKYGVCPSFCCAPEKCAGLSARGSCANPFGRSCVS